MKKILQYAQVVAAMSVAIQVFGDTPLQAKMKALSEIESGNDDNAVGRKGEISRWQIRRSVWEQHFPAKSDYRHFRKHAGNCAIAHILWLEEQYRKHANRNPSAAQLYCMWNMGWAGFKRRDCLVSKCPAAVQERAERFANLYSEYLEKKY